MKNSGQVATRLTCFALLSAIESDLRAAISEVGQRSGRADILPDDVRERATPRWEEDHSGSGDAALDDYELLDYTDFGDLAKTMHRIADDGWPIPKADVRAIAEKLELLAPARKRVCHSRPLEVGDFAGFYEAARAFSARYSAISWTHISETLKHLESEPTYVLSLEIPRFWSTEPERILHNLPLPEFDDTGFIGRAADRKELIRRLRSNHPLVALTGEGGIGKTALALRCLYDLVESTETSYDAIVWLTLKARVLTVDGIREVEDAIGSTLRLVQTVAESLAIPSQETSSVDALLDRIAADLAESPILLAIDNLETLAPQSLAELRPLLANVPPRSKILLTSRQGLGELEDRYQLQAPDITTAMAIAREYARTLNLKMIYAASADELKQYCELLGRSPLLIRWFVASLDAGADPKSLLDRKGAAFEQVSRFCFENLFERLDPIERRMIHVLASARRSLTGGELAFLSEDVPQDEVEWALSTLLRSSLMDRRLVPRKGGLPRVEYALTESAATYVQTLQPPTKEVFEAVQAKLKRLRELAEAEAVQTAAFKFDIFAIHHRDGPDERIAAHYLRQALNASKAGRPTEARLAIKRARELAGTFSEVYRVSAIIETQAGELYRAAEDNAAAVEYDPKSAIARFSYGTFLMRYLDDHDGALTQLEAALALEPGDVTLSMNKAWVLTRKGKFSEAAELYEQVVLPGSGGRGMRFLLTSRSQAAECYRRWSEQGSRTREFDLASRHLRRAIEIIATSVQSHQHDAQLIRTLTDCVNEAAIVSEKARDRDLAQFLISTVIRVKPVYERYGMQPPDLTPLALSFSLGLDALSVRAPELPASDLDGRQLAHIDHIAKAGSFGFLRSNDGTRVFFARNLMRPGQPWLQARVGRHVSFVMGRNAQGPCATDVTFEDVPLGPDLPRTPGS